MTQMKAGERELPSPAGTLLGCHWEPTAFPFMSAFLVQASWVAFKRFSKKPVC